MGGGSGEVTVSRCKCQRGQIHGKWSSIYKSHVVVRYWCWSWAELAQWCRARRTSERSGLMPSSGKQKWLRIIACRWRKSASDDESTLALKPMGRVIRIPKQRVPVAPQNGPQSNKTMKMKKKSIGVERFSRLYFPPGFIPEMHSMHSDISISG